MRPEKFIFPLNSADDIVNEARNKGDLQTKILVRPGRAGQGLSIPSVFNTQRNVYLRLFHLLKSIWSN